MNVKAKEALAKVAELFESTHWTSGTMINLTSGDDGEAKKVYCAIGGLRHTLGFHPNIRPGLDDDGRFMDASGWDEWLELIAYRESLRALVEVLALRDDSLGVRARIAIANASASMADPYALLQEFDEFEDIVITFNDGEEFGGKDGVIELFKISLTKEFPAEATS